MAKNTIKLKKYSDIIEEYEAEAAITPGMLIEMTDSGTVQAHSNAGQTAEKIFALENELEGEGIDDAYAAEDRVQCWVAGRGDQVNAILADGEDIDIGDKLESNGAGYLQEVVAESAGGITYPGSVVAVALEALDLSGSSGTESSGALGYNKRLKVRVI